MSTTTTYPHWKQTSQAYQTTNIVDVVAVNMTNQQLYETIRALAGEGSTYTGTLFFANGPFCYEYIGHFANSATQFVSVDPLNLTFNNALGPWPSTPSKTALECGCCHSMYNYGESVDCSGCTDVTADNFNGFATVDDGSCEYMPESVPDQYQLWQSGSSIKSLVDASVGMSGNATDTISFLTQAQSNAGWTSGDSLYFQDVGGECWIWLGTQDPNGFGLVSAQYGTASTSNICSGPSTDAYLYNFIRVDQSMDCTNLDIPTNGQTLKETFTTASSGSTFSAVAQGSHDFWDALGQPNQGDWVTITGDDPDSCYLYYDRNLISSWNNGNVSWAGVQYNQSIPTVDTTEPDCAQCRLYLQQSATYHTWEDCNTGLDRPLYVPDAFTNVPPNNDDVYNAFSTANGSNLQTGDITKITYGETDYCFKYTGESSGHNSFQAVDLSWTIASDTSCENCLNPSTTDQNWYNWKLHHNSCGTNPTTKSITTQGSGAPIATQRQGSYDFWVAMGEPNIGQFVTYGQPGQDELCWEYMGDSKSAVGATEYNVTAPVPDLTAGDHFADCTACYNEINSGQLYHLFSLCANPGNTFIGLGNNNGSTTIDVTENTAIYTAALNPSQGQCFEFLTANVCVKYEGQGTAAQATASPQSMNPADVINAGTFHNTCNACQTPPGDYHKWVECGGSTAVNMVGVSGTNTTAENSTFWTNAGTPNPGEVVLIDSISETRSGNCYEYLGISSTAESGFEQKNIDTPVTYTSETPCNDCMTPQIPGCMDPVSIDYNPAATVDDGSCTYTNGCTDPLASNYNGSATLDDGSCIFCVYGCTDPTASNYNPSATCDDGSCSVVQGGTGCTIAFGGDEECQPDGTSTVTLDLSSGGGLSNVITKIDGAPFGTSTGCTPPSSTSITGLTQGQVIDVTGECSYAKEDYNFALGGNIPEWANPTCGEETNSTTTFSADTDVYVWYDTSSWGLTPIISSYNAVIDWLDDQALNNGWTGNVYHILATNEDFVDWADYPMSGNISITGGTNFAACTQSGSTVFQLHSNFTKVAAWITHHNIPNWYHQINYSMKDTGNVTCNKNVDGTSMGSVNVHTDMINKATCINNNGAGYVGPSSFAGAGNNGLGALPQQQSPGGNFLNVIFLDEATNFNTGQDINAAYGNPTGTGGYTTSSTTNQDTQSTYKAELQVQPSYITDYNKYVTSWKAWTGSGRTFMYPTYPIGGNGVTNQHYGMSQLAAGMIFSGNKTIPDGHFEAGTANALHPVAVGSAQQASFGKIDFFEDITQGTRHNVFWDKANAVHPEYGHGGLDNYGWGANVEMNAAGFTAQTFETDLTTFLSSGPPIITYNTTCTDEQCLFIKAVDENGAPIIGYPIKLNGVSIGTTNAGGVASHILTGPGPAVVNDCYTFTAVGGCFQSLVTIVVSQAQYTTTLNCILGCMSPESWNYNPLAGVDDGSCMFPLEEDPRDSMSRCELLKIDTECQFATDIYNIYKHDRFGFERACLNNIEGHINKKYSSDWVDRLLPDYGAETMTKTKHTRGATPVPLWVDANCGMAKGSCDGSECIVVIVKNKDGKAIPDYEIVLDGLYAGKTDENGELKLSIPNAEEDKEHKLNLCHCFTTSGNCNSQRIKLTVDGVDCDDCGNIKMF